MDFYREEKVKSDKFLGLKKPGEELIYMAPNKPAVTALQSFLNEEGYRDQNGETLAENGNYDTSTANAVLRYQNVNGLKGDGIAGDKTWNSIYRKKREKEEDVFGKNSRLDVWVKNYNPLTENKKDDGEDFHERVRKRWGNGKLPERAADFFGLKAPEGSTVPRIIPPNPELYIAGTEKRKKSDYHTTEGRVDYPTFDESGYAPDYRLMSNPTGSKAANTESKDAGEDSGTTKSQIGKNKDYRSYYNFDEISAKEILTDVFDDAMNTATQNQNMFAQASIYSTREKIRDFDEKTIVSAYYLNDSDGAGTFGHAGVLLVNDDGEGILFSYYPQNADDYVSLLTSYSPSEMRIAVLDYSGIEKLLKGETILAPSTSGERRTEKYNRYTKFDISADRGRAMFEQAVAISGVSPDYNVVLHNCDHMALSILWAGKIAIDKDLLPNNTYKGSEGIDI